MIVTQSDVNMKLKDKRTKEDLGYFLWGFWKYQYGLALLGIHLKMPLVPLGQIEMKGVEGPRPVQGRVGG
jgi:hypothetical protein